MVCNDPLLLRIENELSVHLVIHLLLCPRRHSYTYGHDTVVVKGGKGHVASAMCSQIALLSSLH